MSQDEQLPDIEYVGYDPTTEKRQEIQFNPEYARIILTKQKRRRDYQAVYDAEWNEVISFEVCEVYHGKDDRTWPIDDTPPENFEPLGTVGLVFLYMMPFGRAFFPIWGRIPVEDVPKVRKFIEERLDRDSLPGLAHHGTAAAVKHTLRHCEILNQKRAEWYDWTRKGRMAKPNPKFGERGPDYIYCKEGMAIDFFGAGEQLEQMSTFWPWRMVKRIFPDDKESVVRYQWFEDSYIFEQQVLEDEDRHEFSEMADDALQTYRTSDGVHELLLIRPWSFPSKFHRTWDKLEAFSSKASRNRFPPVHDFQEE